jgi:hypothetical protein
MRLKTFQVHRRRKLMKSRSSEGYWNRPSLRGRDGSRSKCLRIQTLENLKGESVKLKKFEIARKS